MFARTGCLLCGIAVVVCQLAIAPRSSAQGLHNILRAQDRMFPAVGPGVQAIKSDSAGHYYVLAEPATSILIYNATGKLLGQIPNANSGGTTIRYAVSIDVDPQERLFVADRGANAVKIFKSDGALVANIPVTAPTSVVALSGGQFAVTQLQSKRLVKIMDVSGATIRTFGDPADQPGGEPVVQTQPDGETKPKPPAPVVMDRGRIIGDSKGNIYFAFTSVTDPTLQRFDRFGYSAYESIMPATDFGAIGGRDGRDIEIGYTMAGVAGPDSVTAWTDLHSVRASIGRGIGGRGRGAAAANAMNNANSSNNANSGTSSSSGSGDSSSDPDIAGDISDVNGDTVSYNSGDNSDTLLFSGSGNNSSLLSPGMFSMGGGAFHLGGMHGFGGGEFGGFGGEFGAHPNFGAFGGGHPPGAGGARGPGGEDHFHFHPGFSTYRATATLKVALDDPSKHKLEKPVLTAVGVDPHTLDAWAAVGDTLVRIDNLGNRLDVYYLSLPNGATIRPTSILVEPDRFLIAADPWGIYEFPRPDKPSANSAKPAGANAPSTLVPQQIPPSSAPKSAK
jgi:hypothetical protein